MTVMDRCPASGEEIDNDFKGRCPGCGSGVGVTDENKIEHHQLVVERRHKGGRHRAH